jgi:hypothetical protein
MAFCVSGFGDSQCSGGANPFSFEFLVAEMPKWLSGTFSFRVSGFGDSRCSGGVTHLSFEVLVAEMPPGCFFISRFEFQGFLMQWKRGSLVS